MDSRLGTNHRSRVGGPYGSYLGARRVVGHLPGEGSLVERLSKVGEDSDVDQVMGREEYGLGSAQGAGVGALVGVSFGALVPFGLIEHLVPAVVLVLLGLAFGAGVGPLAGLLSHAFSGRRGVTSAGATRASRYGVAEDRECAEEARGMLSALKGNLRRRAP